MSICYDNEAMATKITRWVDTYLFVNSRTGSKGKAALFAGKSAQGVPTVCSQLIYPRADSALHNKAGEERGGGGCDTTTPSHHLSYNNCFY